MKLPVAITLALLATTLPLSASAADFSQVDLTPYLIYNTRSHVVHIEQPSAATQQEGSLFLTHGGALFSTSSSRSGTAVPRSYIFQGIATTRQLRAMRSRLNALNIRRMTSCQQVVSPAVNIAHDVVWYSIDGQRNAFTIFTNQGSLGLPSCPSNVLEALSALTTLALQVRDNPGSEIFAQ